MSARALTCILCLLVLASANASSQSAPTITFHPTRAQQKFPRVRAARTRRTTDIRALFQKAGVAYPPARVLLRIFKLDDVVELWVRPRGRKEYVHLKDYRVCARSGVPGPKRRRGDLQVPEGFYRVSGFNPASNFLLSMRVDYPNRSDRIRGHPRHPGGDIFIHGDCVTIGCVPITDRWIEELYLICLDTRTRRGRPPLVHIFPTQLDDEGMTRLGKRFAERERLLAFWREIRPGYLHFERHRIPAPVTVRADGRYAFPQADNPLEKPGEKR